MFEVPSPIKMQVWEKYLSEQVEQTQVSRWTGPGEACTPYRHEHTPDVVSFWIFFSLICLTLHLKLDALNHKMTIALLYFMG